jgi:phosphoribosylglycinamide formyltransferase-1
VVLISGRGSNLKAILEAIEAGELGAAVSAVISSRREANGLNHARHRHIDARVLDHRDYPSREDYDRALQAVIDGYAPDLVVLAGFMRILTPAFVRHYRGRLVNIHPSLLPALRGLDTHRRALEQGLSEHGASVHLVTEELDGGPVILQARVPILPDDNAAALAARVLAAEHRLYAQALQLLVEQRVRWDGDRLLYEQQPLLRPLQLDTPQARHAH